MAILKVHKYPSPILREVCDPASLASGTLDTTVKGLIADMIETMYAFPGCVGIAAPQVGSAIRVVITDVSAKTTKDKLKVLVNPKIVQASRNKVSREGCLSFPEYLANIKRATRLTIECLDEHGAPQTYQVRDFEAVAIQHELDHLDGILLIDRVHSLKTDLIKRTNIPKVND